MNDLFGNDATIKRQSSSRKFKAYKSTRSSFAYFNLDIFRDLEMTGTEQMPVIKPVEKVIDFPIKLMAFDKAYSYKTTNCIVHFYEEDRKFMRVIRNPYKYLPFLRHCTAVIEPDLSQYVNMPYSMRLYNAWLNRATAAWLQNNGVTIIQNVTWSLKDSYYYSLAGRAKHTVIAVNCMGVQKYNLSKYIWNEGYKNVVLPLQPTTIIRYGNKMQCEKEDISVYYENTNLKILKNGK